VEGLVASLRGSIAFLAVAGLVAVSGLGCHAGPADSEQMGRMGGKTIQQVQEEHTDRWMTIPGVVGTAIGQRDDKPCILILTASNTERVRQKIPSTVEGYPVVVQYVGEVRALDK
jgi:hypothetical protein